MMIDQWIYDDLWIFMVPKQIRKPIFVQKLPKVLWTISDMIFTVLL